MLLRFQVANHASLRDQQELSLIADKPREDRAEGSLPQQGLRIVPVAAVFGANGSGKSNLIEALRWMRSAVLESFALWNPDQTGRITRSSRPTVPRNPFAFRHTPSSEPSRFEVDLLYGDKRYNYGFTCDDERILTEWLYDYPGARARKLFERDKNKQVDFGRAFTGPRKASADMLRDNSLYLSVAAAQGNEKLGLIYHWFAEHLLTADDYDYASRVDFTLQKYFKEPGPNQDLALDLLRIADLGITGIEIEDKNPDAPIERELERMAEALNEVTDHQFVLRDSITHRVFPTHQTSSGKYRLPLPSESSGSISWIGIIGPVIQALSIGSTLCVDELDARLHPTLVDALISLFQAPERNTNGAQLVFNSHATTLLGSSSRTHLYRDQIWFTEKDYRSGATSLYPLTDFNEREDGPNFERRYYAGKFGAIPYFSDRELTAFSAATARRELEPQKEPVVEAGHEGS